MARHSSNRNPDRVRPPLDRAGLERLALHYLGRYATTRAKLADYLHRKVKDRGWADAGGDVADVADVAGDLGAARPVEAIVAHMAALGYVDDRAFAQMRSAALGRRGYGRRRQTDALRAAGVDDADREAALAAVDQEAAGADTGWNPDDGGGAGDGAIDPADARDSSDRVAATAYARRKRIGPFATGPADPDMRRKALAAMMRAGHPYDLARRFVDCAPGEMVED